MKKTLFAMLALATMMPAMADNWEFCAWFNIYDNHKDKDLYSLYLIQKDASDITTVKTMVEEQSFSDFTSTSGDSYSFYAVSIMNLVFQNTAQPTDFSTTIDAGNIWGVCVYQNEDDVKFQVAQGFDNNGMLNFNTTKVAGSGYTSFKADSPVVPEPATATLSLLALAGLASRRRRK